MCCSETLNLGQKILVIVKKTKQNKKQEFELKQEFVLYTFNLRREFLLVVHMNLM